MEVVTKISYEQAESEIYAWLDHKRIRETKREKRADDIKELIEAAEEGLITVDQDNFIMTQQLTVPITGTRDGEEEVVLSELKFKPRLRDSEVDRFLKGVKPTDAFGMVRAYTCALTKNEMVMVGKLDTQDSSLTKVITGFFL